MHPINCHWTHSIDIGDLIEEAEEAVEEAEEAVEEAGDP